MFIDIKGARTHNLKNINLKIPRNKLITFTGLSGSGKSSLAFDTIFAEGQLRYVSSLSPYARQFLSMMDKPDIDYISGLSPAIAIEQKKNSHNPRSTVGTITEIYDYLRLLYARVGTAYCPTHQIPLDAKSIFEIANIIIRENNNDKSYLCAPIVLDRKGEHRKLLEFYHQKGFIRFQVNNSTYLFENIPQLDPQKKHNIDLIVDRLVISSENLPRILDAFNTIVELEIGLLKIQNTNQSQEYTIYSTQHSCPKCQFSISTIEPKLFSFNSPIGACKKCDGLGRASFFDENMIINDELSIKNGAIKGWTPKHKHHYKLISALAEHYNINLIIPFKDLVETDKNIILHGSPDKKGDENSNFKYRRRRKIKFFPGVIPYFEKRYKETPSELVREELAKYLTDSKCVTCEGSRLCSEALNVKIENTNIHDLCNASIIRCLQTLTSFTLSGNKLNIATPIIKEINNRLQFLTNVGLDYLSLNRSTESLSGGENQRIKLASQIGSGLVGVMYVLDEPTIGLHPKDNQRLVNTLIDLKNLGNTVIIVEHDELMIQNSDYIVDIGPGAGKEGGEIIFSGTYPALLESKKSLTAQYLNKIQEIPLPKQRTLYNSNKEIKINQATLNNLQSISTAIPIGLLTCVTGVSGSGKSTLINEILYQNLYKKLNNPKSLHHFYGCKSIQNNNWIEKIICIDQSPIGRTPRSNPATYTGIFTAIREIFTQTVAAKTKGYKIGRFSFNVKGGRCEKCEGGGVIKVSMHFLSDIYVICDECSGKRYNPSTLDIRFKEKNIYETLEMTVEEAALFFQAFPTIKRKCELMIAVGLGYIKLGQSAITLSGGEAQRIKLSRELSKKGNGKTLYILDEPTTGLHFHDIKLLSKILNQLKNQGNTLIVIEHNLDLIKTADWIIDLGPEGGDKGGNIVISGTPEQVSTCPVSYTGQYLKKALQPYPITSS
jgi:excinuclease ABC subunit A